MDIEFDIFQTGEKWMGECKKYLVVLEDKTLDGLLDKIEEWVKARFPGENVRIILRNRLGEPRYDIYIPGPARPIEIDPGMFRV